MSTWMTRQEAADYLRTTTKTIDRNVKRGRLTRYYVGGSPNQPRFKVEELDALMEPKTGEDLKGYEEILDDDFDAVDEGEPPLCHSLTKTDPDEWSRIHKETSGGLSPCFACA